MQRRVEIVSKNRIFSKAIFKIDEVRLRHTLYNGQMSPEITRLSLDRGDAVAALVYDRDSDTLLFVEQFRYATHEKGPGWLSEVPAGMIDPGETPEAALVREIHEEIGYAPRLEDLQFIACFYLSPGGTSERIFLYYTPVSGLTRISEGGGLVEEGEDIRKLMVKADEALRRLDAGEIVDAKTIIALQWYRLHESRNP
jgi:nudix-type nucleoside diphosphatase (YffH/AdpP family)